MKVLAVGASGSSAGMVVPAPVERGVGLTAQAFVTEQFSYGTLELADLMGKALGRTVTAETTDFGDWVDRVPMPPGPSAAV